MTDNHPQPQGQQPPYKPLCVDAWAIPPSSRMLEHGNSYHTCSKCGEPVETVELKGQQPDSTHTIIKDLLWQNISAEKAEALLAQREQAARLEADNNARNVLHGILSEDVDSALDHSDIETIFVKRLAPKRQDSEGGL